MQETKLKRLAHSNPSNLRQCRSRGSLDENEASPIQSRQSFKNGKYYGPKYAIGPVAEKRVFRIERSSKMVCMRVLLGVLVSLVTLAARLEACSCGGGGSPCLAAGMSAAVFTGTVMDIVLVPAQFSARSTTPSARRLSGQASERINMKPGFRIVRIRLAEVFSGVEPWQREIEVVTGFGDGDCGYPFQPGADYVVYAAKNADGRLATSTCSRTRPVAKAAEDFRYFEARAGASTASEIRVRTGSWGVPGKSGNIIVAEREGFRYRALTDAVGDAIFADLPPGEYRIHAESDGDLPDDPKIQLYAKGCGDVTLFRTLRIVGRVTTKDGLPAARVAVQVRSTSDAFTDSRMTGPDGHYELPVTRPGQYYLGVNLNRTPTRDTPYLRWFYPGTDDQASAAVIEFSGKPDTRTYDFTLPDAQSERLIEGIVLTSDGLPMPNARVTVFDSSENVVAFDAADAEGRFHLRVFADVSYRLHAVWPDTPAKAVSAVPVDIQPGTGPLSLRLILAQPGNSALNPGQKGPH